MWKELPQEHINKAVAVASPGLVSTEAASDGVTLFLTTVFLVIALWKVMSFFSCRLLTTPIFSHVVYHVFFLNSAANFFYSDIIRGGSPGGELRQALDCLHGCQRWSLRASAVTLSISKSVFSPYHQQTGSFHSHQRTIGEGNARNVENGVVLVGT